MSSNYVDFGFLQLIIGKLCAFGKKLALLYIAIYFQFIHGCHTFHDTGKITL